MSAQQHKINIFGCGSLAFHLASHLSRSKKFQINVYNHRQNKKLKAFKKLGCKVHGNFKEIDRNAEVFLICVSDDHIADVASNLKGINSNALLIHTSGSKSLNELKNGIKNCGVMYPVQSFSEKAKINWKKVPLLLEGNHQSAEKMLKKFAANFSARLYFTDSASRLKIHLAAVLVNNFTNALYTAADGLLKDLRQKEIGFEILMPLIDQGVNKLHQIPPLEAQTGPAKRHDKKVLNAHLLLLNRDKVLKQIYSLISQLIVRQQIQAR